MPLPIPASCAGRPTVGGLVVPYISVQGSAMVALGSVHRTRVVECILANLCQVCGGDLTRPMVVFATQSGVDRRYSGEPPVCGPCAGYSAAACPMLNGRQKAYRIPDRHVGTKCDKPGCDCAGWVFSDDDTAGARAGQVAEPWFAVWLPSFQVAVNDRREVHGVAWRGIEPLRIRPVVRPHAPEEAL